MSDSSVTELELQIANELSLKLMEKAIIDSNQDSLIAVIALTLAASRAAGYSGLPLKELISVFKSQYNRCDEDSRDDNVLEKLENSSLVKKAN
jgi:hypothetical protein